jgi:ribosomal protein L13E
VSWHDNAARDPSIGPITLVGRSVARARGYSMLELERAGITEAQARELGLAIDRERKSMVGSNVLQLRTLL